MDLAVFRACQEANVTGAFVFSRAVAAAYFASREALGFPMCRQEVAQ